MADERGDSRGGKITDVATFLAGLIAIGIAGSCRNAAPPTNAGAAAVLRVAVGSFAQAANPTQGLRQVNQILVVEGLARTGEDGRMQPALAESWSLADNGRTVTVKLR